MDKAAEIGQNVASAIAPQSSEGLQASAELVMKLDVGTLSGVIGVILTIVFFVVGYRQTIGAKRERAAAANKEIVETLLRRFTLEEDFKINVDGIEKVLVGKAIEHKVRSSDLHSVEYFESILYGRVIDSDYITQDRRRVVAEKIEACFKSAVRLSNINPDVDRGSIVKGSIWDLGFGSAALAGALSALFSSLALDKTIDKFRVGDAALPILIAMALIAATAIALVMFVRLREKERSISPLPSDFLREGMLFEKSVAHMLAKAGYVVRNGDGKCDFIVETACGSVAIELKVNVQRFGTSRVGNFVKMVDLARHQNNCIKGLLVSKAPVSERIKRLGTSDVAIIEASEMLELLRRIGAGGALSDAAE